MNVLGKKVGFIGTGNMASSLISGMISAGFKPNNIFVINNSNLLIFF